MSKSRGSMLNDKERTKQKGEETCARVQRKDKQKHRLGFKERSSYQRGEARTRLRGFVFFILKIMTVFY